MMSDESFQEKTEAPSPKKRREAHEKGKVPRSQEVNAAFLLLMAGFLLHVAGPGLGRGLAQVFQRSVNGGMNPTVTFEGSVLWLREIGWMTMGAMVPVVLAMAGAAALVAGIQARGVLSPEPLKPQWSRLSPLKNGKRIWGIKAPVELAKSLFKLTIMAVVVYFVLTRAWEDLPYLAHRSPFALLLFMQSTAARLLISAGAAYLIIGMADYAYQIWSHERSLKMTKEEVKRELKETEGDQIIRVRRRTMARSLARRRMLLSVSDADVVVTNPTHIAVALKYDPGVAPAPVVLAMGARKVAEQIKTLAAKAEVPVVESKPLARALYSTAKVGYPIPEALYVAVAEILAFVMTQRSRARAAWRGSGTA
jgi:flagellar biosynthesis protein FlhB